MLFGKQAFDFFADQIDRFRDCFSPRLKTIQEGQRNAVWHIVGRTKTIKGIQKHAFDSADLLKAFDIAITRGGIPTPFCRCVSHNV